MILVTGGSGFIGSHTVRALSDLGEHAELVDDDLDAVAEALDLAKARSADITRR
jgi:nucleoside-diphosphate-sugar epimerase